MNISFSSRDQFITSIDPICSPSISTSPPPGVEELNDFVYQLYSAKHPDFDIVFVHGLQQRGCKVAHWKTWSADGGKTIWPQTLLAKRFPNSRILCLSYEHLACPESDEQINAGWLNWGARKCTGESVEVETAIADLASCLTQDATFNAGVGRRPVVLVGHSVGGLVIKQMIVSAHLKMRDRSDIQTFLSEIRGVFHFALPHTGSFMADAACKIRNFSPSPMLSLMTTGSAVRNSLNEDFSRVKEIVRSGFPEFCLGENLATDFGGVPITVVENWCAAEGVEQTTLLCLLKRIIFPFVRTLTNFLLPLRALQAS